MSSKTLHHLINSNENGYTFKPDEVVSKNILHIIHNAGLFSCSSIALEEIMIYFNRYGKMPDEVNRTQQYLYYKNLPYDNLIPVLFNETDERIEYTQDARITTDDKWFQWSRYSLIDFASVLPFVRKYFMPSDRVLERIAQLEQDYEIDYENTVGVLYRGNDKVKECGIASYWAFGDKLSELWDIHDEKQKLLISPDETECLAYFEGFCEDKLIHPTQWLHMPKDSNTSIFMHLSQNERPEHAINVLTSIIMISKCKHVVSHSGNMSFWCALYRGNVTNFHQFREDRFI